VAAARRSSRTPLPPAGDTPSAGAETGVLADPSPPLPRWQTPKMAAPPDRRPPRPPPRTQAPRLPGLLRSPCSPPGRDPTRPDTPASDRPGCVQPGTPRAAGQPGVSPARLASLHHILDRQPDQFGVDPRGEVPDHLFFRWRRPRRRPPPRRRGPSRGRTSPSRRAARPRRRRPGSPGRPDRDPAPFGQHEATAQPIRRRVALVRAPRLAPRPACTSKQSSRVSFCPSRAGVGVKGSHGRSLQGGRARPARPTAGRIHRNQRVKPKSDAESTATAPAESRSPEIPRNGRRRARSRGPGPQHRTADRQWRARQPGCRWRRLRCSWRSAVHPSSHGP
jgi:hypothetical protein